MAEIRFDKLNGAVPVSRNSKEESVTVGALITALQSCDPAAIIVTEGCDCDGYVLSLETGTPGEVYLRRGNG